MPLFNIVLNKDNDSGSGDSGNDCCPFSFGSVMGQEDLFRETSAGSGTRVSNNLTARIVWATSVDATSRVEYGIGESVVYGSDTGVVASGNTYHEVFISGLNLDTLYHFRVISTSSECDAGGETLTSEAFWFSTGGILAVESNQLEFSITSEVVTVGSTIAVTAMDDLDITPDLTGIAPANRNPLLPVDTLSIPTIGATPSKTAGSTMLFTDTPSTSVA